MLGLRQIDVAPTLGADSFTLANWEKGATQPMVWYYPAIMDFLGYCPYQRVVTLGDRIRLHRIHQGLSHRGLARKAGVDPGSISRWETGGRAPRKQLLGLLWDALEVEYSLY